MYTCHIHIYLGIAQMLSQCVMYIKCS